MQQFEVTGVRSETKQVLVFAEDARDAVKRFESMNRQFAAKEVNDTITLENFAVADRCEACGKVLFEEQNDDEDSPDTIRSDSDGNTLCGACYGEALAETLNAMNIRDADGKNVVF